MLLQTTVTLLKHVLGLPYWDFTIDAQLLNSSTSTKEIDKVNIFSANYFGPYADHSLTTGRFAYWAISKEANVYNVSNNRYGKDLF